MTIRNVGIVFSPTLNIPAVVFGLFLSEFGSIFSSPSSGKSNVTPEASTSADRIKHKYLEAEERLNRNSMKFKNGIPNNLCNLEKFINGKYECHCYYMYISNLVYFIIMITFRQEE
jgi:RalA-binding protein 1